MGERPGSTRKEQAALRSRLRSEGKTWVKIAAIFQERYRVNARVAFRLAHGLSQKDVADLWNERWPDDPRTLKNISYWEQWPASTGYQPSLVVLGRLAEIYQCSPAALIADYSDHRHLDKAHLTRSGQNPGRSIAVEDDHATAATVDLGDSSPKSFPDINTADFNRLAQVLTLWAQHFNPSLDRRSLLLRLSGAFTVAAASPIFDLSSHSNATEAEPERASSHSHHLERAQHRVQSLRRHGDIVGPQSALHAVLSERHHIRRFLTTERLASGSRTALLSIDAELAQLAGWQLFNLGDYRTAQTYYEDARATAHDAENTELVTYILCTMSHLATWQGRPRVGIDHAVAAQLWARRSGTPHALAYAADVAARAYAADHEWTACHAALDEERSAMERTTNHTQPADWWYFHDESFYWATKSECALQQAQPDKALAAAINSLRRIDPTNVHNYSSTLTFKSEALIQQGEIDEACHALTEVVRLTAVGNSQRIQQRISTLRNQLTPHASTRAVTQLDNTLQLYPDSRPKGSGITKRS